MASGMSSNDRLPLMTSPERFLAETSEEERAAIVSALTVALVSCIECEQPVWLEGLGVLTSEVRTQQRHRVEGEHLIVWRETVRVPSFEKCAELVTFHRERYRSIAETSDLARRAHPLLPRPLSQRWSERTLARLLRGLLRLIRYEVVLCGYSEWLREIGTFCCLHNRQGSTLADWYAGADIFLKPRYEHVLRRGQEQRFERPVVQKSSELWEAAFGAAVARHEVDLRAQLETLGYAADSFEQRCAARNPSLEVSVFCSAGDPMGERCTFLYCTDGLRQHGIALGKRGNELCLQLDVLRTTSDAREALSPPIWPMRALVMGWILAQHSPRGGVALGAGLSCGIPLPLRPLEDGNPALSGILATELQMLRAPQLSTDGPFVFMNLVLITDAEAELAEQSSPLHLAALLRHRGLDQVTKPFRRCLAAKTSFASAHETDSRSGSLAADTQLERAAGT